MFYHYLSHRTQCFDTRELLAACRKKSAQRLQSVRALHAKNDTLLKELTDISLDADEYEARLGAAQNTSRRLKADVVRTEAQLKVAQGEIQQLRTTPPRAAPPYGFRPVAPAASTWKTPSRSRMRGEQKSIRYCKKNRDLWIEWLKGKRMKSHAVDPALHPPETRRAFWEETHQQLR